MWLTTRRSGDWKEIAWMWATDHSPQGILYLITSDHGPFLFRNDLWIGSSFVILLFCCGVNNTCAVIVQFVEMEFITFRFHKVSVLYVVTLYFTTIVRNCNKILILWFSNSPTITISRGPLKKNPSKGFWTNFFCNILF